LAESDPALPGESLLSIERTERLLLSREEYRERLFYIVDSETSSYIKRIETSLL
jgi:hypothetical protein